MEFQFDSLTAPPIMALFTPNDIQELYKIATSLRYNGNMSKKREMIDAIMKRRGFRYLGCGTNRVVYSFLESKDFVAKVALDRVGLKDSGSEYINQAYFQPFCCKIFEVDPTGVIAFVERVNPISSIEEFLSVADDVFNMMVTKIIGKYVVDDLGTKTYMNFGIRQNSNGYTFGPVIIDFPYVYELDGAKLKCQTIIKNKYTGMDEICNGDIDYQPGFNGLICTKCGREYKAMDLAKESPNVKFEYDSKDIDLVKRVKYQMRARIIDNGKIICDSGHSTKHYISKEEFETMANYINDLPKEVEVEKTVHKKKETARQYRDRYYTELQRQYYNEMAKKNNGPFNPAMVSKTVDHDIPVGKTVKEIAVSSAPATIVSDDEFQLNESERFIDVVETVDRHGNLVTSEVVEQLEKATFPEMETDTVYEPDHEAMQGYTEEVNEYKTASEDVTTTGEADKATPVFYEIEQPKTVYTDEQVAQMAKENALRNNDELQKVEVNTILDAEADKAMIDPFTRPYAVAGSLVNVNHKISADDPIVTAPNPMDPVNTIPETEEDKTLREKIHKLTTREESESVEETNEDTTETVNTEEATKDSDSDLDVNLNESLDQFFLDTIKETLGAEPEDVNYDDYVSDDDTDNDEEVSTDEDESDLSEYEEKSERKNREMERRQNRLNKRNALNEY